MCVGICGVDVEKQLDGVVFFVIKGDWGVQCGDIDLIIVCALLWLGVRQGDFWGYQIIRFLVKGIFDDFINVVWLCGIIGYQWVGGDFYGLMLVGGFMLCLYLFNIVNYLLLILC